MIRAFCTVVLVFLAVVGGVIIASSFTEPVVDQPDTTTEEKIEPLPPEPTKNSGEQMLPAITQGITEKAKSLRRDLLDARVLKPAGRGEAKQKQTPQKEKQHESQPVLHAESGDTSLMKEVERQSQLSPEKESEEESSMNPKDRQQLMGTYKEIARLLREDLDESQR